MKANTVPAAAARSATPSTAPSPGRATPKPKKMPTVPGKRAVAAPGPKTTTSGVKRPATTASSVTGSKQTSPSRVAAKSSKPKSAETVVRAPAKRVSRKAATKKTQGVKAAQINLFEPDDVELDIPTPAPDEPLVKVCRQYLRAGMPVNQVMTALMTDGTIRGMCAKAVSRYRLPQVDAEEVLQELAVLFYSKLLPRLREPEKVWQVCSVTVRRIAAARKAKRTEVSLHGMAHAGMFRAGVSDEGDAATAIAEIIWERSQQGEEESSSLEGSVAARVDRERAFKEFAAKLSAHHPGPTPKTLDDKLLRNIAYGPPRDPDPRLCDPNRASPLVSILFDPSDSIPMPPADQPIHIPNQPRKPVSYGRQLAKIRDQLGLAQKDLAQALGISESTCAQYLAGLHGIPADIWREVLELKRQGAPQRRRLKEMFGRKSIKTILALWIKRAEAASECPATLAELARIMGVNKSTVTRWARNEQRPSLERLGELELRLQRWLMQQPAAPRGALAV